MTTIAYDGKSIAADGRAVRYSAIVADDIEKLFTSSSSPGTVIGVSGDVVGQSVAAWIATRWDKSAGWNASSFQLSGDPPGGDWRAIVARAGYAVIIEHAGASSVCSLIPVKAPCAIGSGAEFAIGAMAAGVKAKHAVEIAADFDICTGGEIRSYSLVSALRQFADERAASPQASG